MELLVGFTLDSPRLTALSASLSINAAYAHRANRHTHKHSDTHKRAPIKPLPPQQQLPNTTTRTSFQSNQRRRPAGRMNTRIPRLPFPLTRYMSQPVASSLNTSEVCGMFCRGREVMTHEGERQKGGELREKGTKKHTHTMRKYTSKRNAWQLNRQDSWRLPHRNRNSIATATTANSALY